MARLPTLSEQLLMLTLSNGQCSLKGREALRHGSQHLAQRAQRGLLHQSIAVLQALCDDSLQAKTDMRITKKMQRQRAPCMWATSLLSHGKPCQLVLWHIGGSCLPSVNACNI